ncbi:beta-lactamase/transpeptidase-like protein [Trametopsis cervina]|nr:beta-lactamase/transpeptidase-like protein [Trametopsis cervina]
MVSAKGVVGRLAIASSILLYLNAISLAWAQQQLFQTPQQTPQTSKEAITNEIRQFIKDLQDNGTIPGISVAVVHSDGVVELEGFGKKTEDGVGMTADTLFNIASCSKAFLASSVGILMDDFAHGRNVTPLPEGVEAFNWYTRVKDILPDDWQLMNEWANEKATFRDILSHVSGLESHDLSYRRWDSLQDVVRRLRHLRPTAELRQEYMYNNQMFFVGSYVVAEYSGLSYHEFVKERIFTPLNMSTSTFLSSEASERGLLTQTWERDGRRIPFWFTDELSVLNAGAGGVISSAEDLSKWVKMFLHGGVNPATNATILPQAQFDALTTAHSLSVSKPPFPEFSVFGYGLGWNRYSYQGHEILRHAGGSPGVSSQVAFLPSAKVGVVVLCNASGKADQSVAILYRILEDFLGLRRVASARYAALAARDVLTREASPPPGASPPAKQNSDERISSLEIYDGTYANIAYPNVTICAPTTTERSPTCKDVFDNFGRLEDTSASQDTLYVAIPSIWSTHARLHRVEGDRFRLAGTYILPNGYGADKSPFELKEIEEFVANVEFVVEKGRVIGFAQYHISGVVSERRRRGGTPQETADVWFERV